MKKEPLPKYVCRSKGVLYFVKRNTPWAKLETQFPPGDPVPDALLEERDKILSRPAHSMSGTRIKPRPLSRSECVFKAMDRSSKARAKKYQILYEIEPGWSLHLFNTQNGLCAVTGRQLDPYAKKHGAWLPSLDRIDPLKGYTKRNTRIVAYIVNCAMNQFSDDDFRSMCLGVVENHS